MELHDDKKETAQGSEDLNAFELHTLLHTAAFPLTSEIREKLEKGRDTLSATQALDDAGTKLLDNITCTLRTDDGLKNPKAKWEPMFLEAFSEEPSVIALSDHLSADDMKGMINIRNGMLNLQAKIGAQESILEAIDHSLTLLDNNPSLIDFCGDIRKKLQDCLKTG